MIVYAESCFIQPKKNHLKGKDEGRHVDLFVILSLLGVMSFQLRLNFPLPIF